MKMVQEKLFLIVINIQKKHTICFQITGMPSLSFSIMYAPGGGLGSSWLSGTTSSAVTVVMVIRTLRPQFRRNSGSLTVFQSQTLLLSLVQ